MNQTEMIAWGVLTFVNMMLFLGSLRNLQGTFSLIEDWRAERAVTPHPPEQHGADGGAV